MIDLDPDDLALVKKILATHAPGMTVWAYGSRVKGTSHAGSDLDLVILGTDDTQKSESLRTIFSESDLPILIDVLGWSDIPEKFKEEIEMVHEVLMNPSSTN